MQDSVDRLSPLGRLVYEQIQGMGNLTRDPDQDDTHIDLEVLWLYGLLREKCKDDDVFGNEWEELQDPPKVETQANGVPMDPEAAHLQWRLRQAFALIDAAIRANILEPAQLPTDVFGGEVPVDA